MLHAHIIDNKKIVYVLVTAPETIKDVTYFMKYGRTCPKNVHDVMSITEK